METRPKYPIALIKQACPDKAEHHGLFGSPFKLPKFACAVELSPNRLSGQSADGSRAMGNERLAAQEAMHAVDDL